MATSKYFNYTNHKGTNKLIHDLVIEAIQQRGVDIKYLPRSVIDANPILNESDHEFSEAIDIEMYIQDYTGANSMLWEKFGGLTMQDEATFVVSRRRWKEVVGNGKGIDQVPQEGDIIFLPLSGQMYRINKANDDEDFFQFGQYYTYELQCTLFHYGNEDVDTGFGDVDDITLRLQDLDDTGVLQDTLKDSDNSFSEEIEKTISPNKIRIDFGD